MIFQQDVFAFLPSGIVLISLDDDLFDFIPSIPFFAPFRKISPIDGGSTLAWALPEVHGAPQRAGGRGRRPDGARQQDLRHRQRALVTAGRVYSVLRALQSCLGWVITVFGQSVLRCE